MRIVPSRWLLTMIGATYSVPSFCGLSWASSAAAMARWPLEEFPGGGGLGQGAAVGIGDGGLHVRDGREAVLDFLERRQVQEIGQS